MDNSNYYVDTKFKRELESAKKRMTETRKEFGESMKLVSESFRKQFEDFKALTNLVKDKNGKFSFTELLTGGYNKTREQISNKYATLRQGVDSDSSLTDSQKERYKMSYGFIEEEEQKKAFNNSFLGKTTNKMTTEFSKGLSDMIQGYKSFSDVMKDMTGNLADYMVKQLTDAIGKLIFNDNTMGIFTNFLGGILNLGTGGAGTALGFISNIFKHHSGGIIPSGASYSLPGTDEQLALLKGGERVLSPGENVSYESQGGSAPIIVNTFNVKAWDSKDVSRYLLENKQLLNQITFEGIKNNNNQLRTIVRNA